MTSQEGAVDWFSLWLLDQEDPDSGFPRAICSPFCNAGHRWTKSRYGLGPKILPGAHAHIFSVCVPRFRPSWARALFHVASPGLRPELHFFHSFAAARLEGLDVR